MQWRVSQIGECRCVVFFFLFFNEAICLFASKWAEASHIRKVTRLCVRGTASLQPLFPTLTGAGESGRKRAKRKGSRKWEDCVCVRRGGKLATISLNTQLGASSEIVLTFERKHSYFSSHIILSKMLWFTLSLPSFLYSYFSHSFMVILILISLSSFCLLFSFLFFKWTYWIITIGLLLNYFSVLMSIIEFLFLLFFVILTLPRISILVDSRTQ